MTIKTLTAAVALIAGSFATPSVALAQDAAGGAGGTGTVLECREFADNVVGLNKVRGICNAFYFADDPVGECIVLRDMGVLDDLGIETQGECIDWLKGDED